MPLRFFVDIVKLRECVDDMDPSFDMVTGAANIETA